MKTLKAIEKDIEVSLKRSQQKLQKHQRKTYRGNSEQMVNKTVFTTGMIFFLNKVPSSPAKEVTCCAQPYQYKSDKYSFWN